VFFWSNAKHQTPNTKRQTPNAKQNFIMKKLITILTLLLISQVLRAQAPQATSYQAVIRNSSGNVLSNQSVKVRFSIHDSAANGAVVYQETQTPTTNAQGLINLFAGQGAAVTGSFAGINWGNKSKFLQTEIDIAGGNNYTDMGTTQLMSVPYALYSNVANTANTANTATTAANGLPTGTSNGDILYWNGTSWQKLTAGTYGQSLTICDGVPTWGGCSPKITTTAASTISYTTATSGGNVTAEGGVSVTARGVCWSTSINPTVALSTKTVNGAGAGSFTSSITGLTPNTLYHVRAYATNSVGTSYGVDETLITLANTIPTLTTTATYGITSTTATSGGTITANGGVSITARGVCWSTTTNPTIALLTKTADGADVGSFISRITGLVANTTYYVCAYATNSVGTAYGTQQTFTTDSAGVLPRVIIGTQVWTSQNLSVARYRNGDIIPQVTNATDWAALTTGAWCWYNNDSTTYASTYGRLYNWYAVNDSRGLAPQGYHVPTSLEWKSLETYLGGANFAGTAIRGTTGWTSVLYNSNSSGFSGLPGGLRSNFGAFSEIITFGNWWHSTQSIVDTTIALASYLTNSGFLSNSYSQKKTYGFSIRCVRD
jgi:uncharacterized protein (TIGR02145 family)